MDRASPSDLTGKQISRYRILSPLGAGGMGEVFLAEDVELRREAALKFLPAALAEDEQKLRRFVQEARAASALNHPNILTIYEIGQTDDSRFIASEYVRGETLRQKLKNGAFSVSETIEAGLQIASALQAAHEAGIVHRDIKPENLMLRADGLVKVLDFGLVKLIEEKPETFDQDAATVAFVRTNPGVVLGTVTYMSPEQARGREVDARTDIFSLGVVLYEMLAGQTPFAGETVSDMIASILVKEPAPLSAKIAEVPRELERIVGKALQKQLEKRYQTAEELCKDLKSLKQELEFAAKLKESADLSATNLSKSGVQSAFHSQPLLTTQSFSSGDYALKQSRQIKQNLLLVLAAIAASTIALWQILSPADAVNVFFRLLTASVLAALAYFAISYYLKASSAGVIRSIAVLPFDNAGGDAEMEYLSEGISESLINNFSQLSDIKVIARSSSFKYKNTDRDLQEIARALGVTAILTGRVARRGEHLQIGVELVDARSKTQLWGEQYNRQETDLLSVQADISREISEKLRLRLTRDERQQLSKPETANPVAYELLLKGRFYRAKGGTESRMKAVEYFQQAIEIDPAYALAHAELSFSYRVLIGSGALDPKEFVPRAEAAALKALELDETSADAHFALAYLKQDAWDWQAAERGFRRSIESNPNLARAHIGYAGFLSRMARHDEAIAAVKKARVLDPLSLIINANYGFFLYFARRFDESIKALRETIELDENFAFGHLYTGYALAAKEMYEEAIRAYQTAIRLGQDTPSNRIYLGAALAGKGEREKAREILDKLLTGENYVSPGEIAVLYTALGEYERAFESLEKAFAAHDLQLQFIGVDPAFDDLRADGRFQDLLRRIGLPQ